MTAIQAQITQGVAIHGGVGTLSPAALTPDLDRAYRGVLAESLEAGNRTLAAGGTALDAVVSSVRVMEDSPLYNAGRGSNFDERGIVTMDASIMDGGTLRAGAVAGVTTVRNPVELARLVMDRSEHVLLIDAGADAFARSQGLVLTEPSFFHTDRRWKELEEARKKKDGRPNVLGSTENPGTVDRTDGADGVGALDVIDPTHNSGTVGAVARDAAGNLAAATSTGGMANKTWGRVGDSPVIGAGTYASRHCAVSCTGWGEYFIQSATAYEVHSRMALLGESVAEATHHAIWETLERQVPGAGGLIAIDSHGSIEFAYSTPGMYRGWIGDDHPATLAIFQD
jgi:L-asparaginase / beta-aspartyl-peptidase